VTPDALLAAYPDRTRPLVTHYAGPDARIELSVASVGNAVAKAAGLLRDGLGLAPGARISVDLPRHWQLPVWTCAALCVGATCGRLLPGRVDVRVLGSEALDERVPLAADERLVSSCDSFGMPVVGGVPPGVVDVGVEVRSYPDVFVPDPEAGSAARLVMPGRSEPGTQVPWIDLVAAARRAMIDAPSTRGARLWVDDRTPDDSLLLAAAAAPLLLQGSVVIATALTVEAIARVRAVEGVTPDPPELAPIWSGA
jgi:uncharacterized protein (TIGR03089 family)